MNTAFASDLLLAKEGAAERYIDNVIEIKTQEKASAEDKKNISKNNKKDDLENSAKESLIDLDRDKQAIFQAVLKGNRKDIMKLVKEELSAHNSPSDIIDTVLIPAINEVGRLFDSQ